MQHASDPRWFYDLPYDQRVEVLALSHVQHEEREDAELKARAVAKGRGRKQLHGEDAFAAIVAAAEKGAQRYER